jgi:hypothetical protein
MSRSITTPPSRRRRCCETPHTFTRRELLGVLAATPLVGCAGDISESASSTTQPLASAQGVSWTSAIPTVSFSQGSALAHDLKQYTSGFDPAKHEMTLAADSSSLPAGVTLDPTGLLKYDGTSPAPSVTGILIDIRDIARTSSTDSTQGLLPFAARIATAGVIRHFAFDSPSHLGAGPNGFGYGHNYGWYDDGVTGNHPVHDVAVSPPGASGGSMRFTLLPDPVLIRDGGAWVTNFSEDLKTRFNLGDEFFCQWRQRFDAAMLGPNTDAYYSWKQCVISTGDTSYSVWNGATQTGIAQSCRCIELCVTSSAFNTASGAYNDRFPMAYHRCPDCGGTFNLTPSHPEQFLLYQNMMPAPYCGYNNVNNNGNGSHLPNGNCFNYVANEWMTFQTAITIGPTRNTGTNPHTVPNSRIRLWGQRQGQPSVPLIDMALTLTFPDTDPGYGKFWFTCRNPAVRSTTGKTWVSELIISTQRIPDAL